MVSPLTATVTLYDMAGALAAALVSLPDPPPPHAPSKTEHKTEKMANFIQGMGVIQK